MTADLERLLGEIAGAPVRAFAEGVEAVTRIARNTADNLEQQNLLIDGPDALRMFANAIEKGVARARHATPEVTP